MAAVLHYYNSWEGVTAFTTTRHGGYSKDNYTSLNINPHRGDNPSSVRKNLEAVAMELGIDADHIVRQHQIHETNLRHIDERYLNFSEEERERWLEGVDGVVTDMPRTCIGVFTADCIPLLFFDSKKRAVGAAHAGWRGTVKRIGEKLVAFMTDEFGSQPEDIHAIIGPGITLKNFEIGQEVYDTFSRAGFDMTKIGRKYPPMHPGKEAGNEEKWHIDLPECNRLQLIAAGLKPENIALSGIDTYDRHDEFFSARRLKSGFGTMYTGIVIR